MKDVEDMINATSGLQLLERIVNVKDLIEYIDAHKREMSGTMAKVAWAIRTYFNTVGQVGC